MQMGLRAALLAALAIGVAVGGEDGAAVAVIACGRLAAESLFGFCVDSIRGAGAYAGPVYALTDRPECAPPGVTVVPVVVADGCRDNGSLLYKQLKMRLLDVAEERIVLYLDVDVVAGAPLAPLLAHAASVLSDAGSAVSILAYDERAVTRDARDESRLDAEPFHGGVFAVARGRSEGCLAAWAKSVRAAIVDRNLLADPTALKKSRVRDQPLLKRAVDEGFCVFAALPPDTLSKPTPASIDARAYAVLNHLSRSSRLKGKRNGHNITRAHLAKLGADLLDVRGRARSGNWWAAPRCPDLSPARHAPTVRLACTAEAR